MSRRNNENTPKNKLASNASSQGRRNNRKFQTTIKKKHKFSTFSARDFKEAKKHFNMNKAILKQEQTDIVVGHWPH